MKESILIAGSGGLAREFTAYFREQIDVIGYYSHDRIEHDRYQLEGFFYDKSITPQTVGTRNVVVCIGNPVLKRKLYNELSVLGFCFPNFVHHSSVVDCSVNLSEGVVIAPNCTVSPNATLNRLSFLNFNCGVGHDATICEFVQINPGSQIGGGSTIGPLTLVGSNATILDGTTIGAECTVASGSVVFSRVHDGSTVLGNPAKRMRFLE